MADEPLIFYEWDYDAGVVIAYERLGECNGCGDCCMAAIQFAVTGRLGQGSTPWEEHGNGGSSTTAQGVWSEVRVGGQRRFFRVNDSKPGSDRCKNLTEDLRCNIHFTKPLFHKSWPTAPRQIMAFERCSYTFREVARWPLDTLQPSPAMEATQEMSGANGDTGADN
jgi:Fe-S-cluster containining protein